MMTKAPRIRSCLRVTTELASLACLPSLGVPQPTIHSWYSSNSSSISNCQSLNEDELAIFRRTQLVTLWKQNPILTTNKTTKSLPLTWSMRQQRWSTSRKKTSSLSASGNSPAPPSSPQASTIPLPITIIIWAAWARNSSRLFKLNRTIIIIIWWWWLKKLSYVLLLFASSVPNASASCTNSSKNVTKPTRPKTTLPNKRSKQSPWILTRAKISNSSRRVALKIWAQTYCTASSDSSLSTAGSIYCSKK